MTAPASPGSEDARPAGRLPAGRLVMRPVGYLAVGLVWLALALGLLGLWVAPAVHGLVAPPADQEPWATLAASPGDALGRLAVLAPFAVVLAGPVAWYLSCATWPLAALSLVHAGRAVDPASWHEPLSYADRVAAGATTGPPVPGRLPLPLQPVRRSRVTDTLVRFAASGWSPDPRAFGAALPAGVAWALASAGASTALAGPVRVALVAAAVACAARSVVLLRRRWDWRFHRERARLTARRRLERHGERYRLDPRVVRQRPRSAQHRARVDAEREAARSGAEPLTALTSDAIGERRERALRARAARLRGEPPDRTASDPTAPDDGRAGG